MLLVGAFALGYATSGRRQAEPAPAVSAVDEVRAELAARYYLPLSTQVLHAPSIASMLAALKDPYTEYLDAPAYRLLRQETSSSYTGIGVTLLPGSRGLLVVGTQRGPAERAGLRVGDMIVGVGGVPARSLGVAGALTRILGPRGSVALLDVLRDGAVRSFAVRRESIAAPVVAGRLLSFDGDRYGYVRLTAFRRGGAVVLGNELRRLVARGATGFVLDLRNNPGGLFDQSVAVSSLFLARGTVVSLEGLHRPREVYSAFGKPITDLPLVVLVDRYTASSAEIVAAALRDNRRATLVGLHTYGKAVVQSIDPLANGGALAVTTARYFTPAGRDISRVGVKPDLRVRDDPVTRTDEQLAAALAQLASAR